ncbi:MAG: SPOR domain-containing protein [Gemmatimonadota bacterium]|nr:SPOR domain-containing protein [Gemmatimonadota bacterium]
MRRLIALTLAVAACSGGDDRQASDTARPATVSRGPDALALRMPRDGGTARAYLFANLDSAIWSAAGSPPVGRVLAFDQDAGLVALTDDKGQPRRLDLRLGQARAASKRKLSGVTSANGSEIYGIDAKGVTVRLTPSGDWTFESPQAPQALFPQPNGQLIIASPTGASTKLWLIHPPDETILDSATLSVVARGARTQAGDRLYFTSQRGLAGVRTRELSPLKEVRLPGDAAAMAPTPSGDRVYIALTETPRIVVLDRYSESISGTIDLPGPATDLRVDPVGQLLLAKPADGADSAWVVAIGTGKVVGSIPTTWTTDLPAFAHSSTIATLRGADVVFVNGATLSEVRTARGGGKDYWYFFYWNGFRPRSADLDQPVTFTPPDSIVRSDTIPRQLDSTRGPPPLRDASPTMVPPPAGFPPPAAPPAAPSAAGTPGPAGRSPGFLVSFAALLNESLARSTAAGIEVGGVRARVLPTQTGGTAIFRVVLGPYTTREQAERVGRESRRQYWVYEVGT